MSILKYVYIINILQIYLNNINICFWLVSGGFWVGFDNNHNLSIIHRVQKIPIHLGRVDIHQVYIKLSSLLSIIYFSY